MSDTTPADAPPQTSDRTPAEALDEYAAVIDTSRPVYVVPLPVPGEDDILMHPPTDEQWAVFTRMLQQIDISADWTNRAPDKREQRLIQRSVGNVMAILDDCLATEATKDRVDRLFTGGKLKAAEGMALLRLVAHEHGLTVEANAAPSNGPVQLRR